MYRGRMVEEKMMKQHQISEEQQRVAEQMVEQHQIVEQQHIVKK